VRGRVIARMRMKRGGCKDGVWGFEGRGRGRCFVSMVTAAKLRKC